MRKNKSRRIYIWIWWVRPAVMVLLCVGRFDASPGMWKGMCRFDTEMTLGLAFGKVAIIRISYKMEKHC